jgi:predicted RNase H-like HicB family nuclease
MAKQRPAKNGLGKTAVEQPRLPRPDNSGGRQSAPLKALTERLREELAERLRTDKQLEKALTDLAAAGADAARRSAGARLGLKVKVVIYPDPTGGFTAVVPALPGCVTEAETRDELMANLREAIEGYLLCTPGPFELEEGGIEEEVDL